MAQSDPEGEGLCFLLDSDQNLHNASFGHKQLVGCQGEDFASAIQLQLRCCNLWLKAKSATGCRELQSALGEMDRPEADKAFLGSVFKGRVWEACHCPHANFVLAKYIQVMRPQQCQFIYDEVENWVRDISMHVSGCRIVLRLLEYGSHEQVQSLIERICKNISSLGQSKFAIHAIQWCLESEKYRLLVVRALLCQPRLMVRMAGLHRGHQAVMHLLDLPHDEAKSAKILLLTKFGQRPWSCLSRYERVVATKIGLRNSQQDPKGLVLESCVSGGSDFDLSSSLPLPETHVELCQ